MVTHARTLSFAAAVLSAALAGTTCKVVNEDHCANQEVPGNEWCRELNIATPYCSPCRRDYHGCVDYEPFACEGYDNEIGDEPLEDDDGPSESSTGEAESTGEPPASTSDASTTDAGSSGGSGTDGSGSSTASSSG